ncbi:hypothetical protein F2P81_015466 [Scophthalmus maximus]|uniref:N-acetylglucosamine-6-phosphate deacetylase n=1 Tax=Scophthalmus maximus TaxID=52904 RepID=A0A6A4SDF7_SCOMX|nr:hypothetical protein F2P81_015466 [Scophthalmus maximus]
MERSVNFEFEMCVSPYGHAAAQDEESTIRQSHVDADVSLSGQRFVDHCMQDLWDDVGVCLNHVVVVSARQQQLWLSDDSCSEDNNNNNNNNNNMPSNKSVSDAPITQFINCRILRDHKLQSDVTCRLPAGGHGVDFSQASDDAGSGVSFVAQKILEHGVTSFCPTLVTSPADVYHKVLPQVKVHDGGRHGAGVLGLHLEGPFISVEKKGAHPEQFLRTFRSGAGSLDDLMEAYGSLDNVAMVTLAPELSGSQSAVRELCRRGVAVSLGHSVANLSQAEDAVRSGASFITHLFNAMLPFHHRDPGIVGLLTSDQVPAGRTVYYGMIADGIHTNPAALRIAHRAHPSGLVLVTDAIAAMGLPPGRHTLGQQVIEIQGLHAYVAGTKTLSGSIATMDECVRHFKQASDLTLLDDGLNVRATYISGEEVWRKGS